MKVKNIELFNFINSELGNKRLPAKLSLAISVNVEEAGKKIEIYEKERIKIAEAHAKKDENGEPVIENSKYVIEDPVAWRKEHQELVNAEVECAMTTVTIDDITKCDEPGFDSLTVNEMTVIRFMIEK